jgi:hypothetical protein
MPSTAISWIRLLADAGAAGGASDLQRASSAKAAATGGATDAEANGVGATVGPVLAALAGVPLLSAFVDAVPELPELQAASSM